jgi:CDP-diacylglycerol--glycerol-3-phosphate 3-phosphatidyltransferase
VKRYIPNILTLSRLFMAIGIFWLLALFDLRQVAATTVYLDTALAVFILAMITDALDGWLARRLNSSSTFGRISDPFIDKILICGTFACFLGGNFVAVDPAGEAGNVTGVRAWMVVLIFSREIFVTGIRGFSESRGTVFAATLFGKVKMALQCLVIVYLLIFVGHWRDAGPGAATVREILIWATVVFTLASALVYFGRTQRLLTLDEPPQN